MREYDGYRLRLERDADRVRLITKGGYGWTKRYPRIVESGLKNRHKHFVIDGEAIVRGVDGYSDFNALLIPAAINEAIRLETPLHGFTRVVTRDTAYDDQVVPSGSRVLLLYASANRDQRKWHQPERFVTRDNRSHLGFGFGAHVCVRMHLARLEITALMKAFSRRVSRFELGEPKRAINNVLRGFERLPVTVH